MSDGYSVIAPLHFFSLVLFQGATELVAPSCRGSSTSSTTEDHVIPVAMTSKLPSIPDSTL